MQHHKVPICSRCRTAAVPAAVAPYPPESQVSFGVVWRCTTCAWTRLDIGMIGPLVPSAETCLNCGAPTGSTVEAACAACGWRTSGSESPGAAAHLEDARDAAEGGFYNRAFHYANQALLADRGLIEAWRFKAALLLKVGLPRVRERMLAAALEAGAPQGLRVELGEAAVGEEVPAKGARPWWKFW